MKLLITGGAGFIGSHVVEHFAETYPDFQITVLDAITYAADEEFFKNLEGRYHNVMTIRGDIRDAMAINGTFQVMKFDAVIHLAAESHVDNSIENANIFVETNVMGTLNLLNAAKHLWKNSSPDNVFYHVSTDEVYGHLGLVDEPFKEDTPYDPRSPYSASKASSDHFVRAFAQTHALPILISNCSNNYGERQHIEKLIPKAITNLLLGKKIPVYGKGENIRDWLYVGDHVNAIDTIFHKGRIGETYNIGGDNEWSNLEMVKRIINIYCLDMGLELDFNRYIEYVTDRKGHDLRYAINHDKITKELGWEPEANFLKALHETYGYYKNLLDK